MRAHSTWPRCREKKGRTVVVGRYAGFERWLATKALAGAGTLVFAGVLLAAGVLPLIYAAEEMRTGTAATPLSLRLSAVRHAVFRIANEDLPWIGETLRYRKPQRYDVHLIVLGLGVLFFRRFLRIGAAAAITVLCWPLISRRVKVVFTERWIIVYRRYFWRTRFPRSGETLTFRAVELAEARPRLSWLTAANRNPLNEQPRVAQLVYGLRTVNLATPVAGGRTAERIVEALHYAQRKTKPGQFVTPLAHS